MKLVHYLVSDIQDIGRKYITSETLSIFVNTLISELIIFEGIVYFSDNSISCCIII